MADAPDSYFKFVPHDYMMAVHGQPSFIKWGYLMAISHYRCHNHCHGLEDNDEYLRRICEIERESWPVAKAVIFDNDKFFVLDHNGMWQQRRAEEDYRRDLEEYNKRKQRAVKASNIRWKRKRAYGRKSSTHNQQEK